MLHCVLSARPGHRRLHRPPPATAPPQSLSALHVTASHFFAAVSSQSMSPSHMMPVAPWHTLRLHAFGPPVHTPMPPSVHVSGATHAAFEVIAGAEHAPTHSARVLNAALLHVPAPTHEAWSGYLNTHTRSAALPVVQSASAVHSAPLPWHTLALSEHVPAPTHAARPAADSDASEHVPAVTHADCVA